MPRGENSKKYLVQNQGLSQEEAKRLASKGGKRSGEVRRQQASINACLKELMTPAEMVALNQMLIKRAKSGNLKAYELIRDGLGEKPLDKVVMTDIEPAVIAEVEAYVHQK